MEKGTRSGPPYFLKHRCNSQAAIDAALSEGFDGVEIDLVWSSMGEVILSHSHALNDGPPLDSIDFHNCIVAVNVKEYGMSTVCEPSNAKDWFVFDVPGPELDLYCAAGIRIFGRFSQWENQCLHASVTGSLIDTFSGGADEQFRLFTTRRGRTAIISNQLRGGRDSLFVLNRATYIICKKLP